MLVPQAMAYAMLAGLPPEVGLYASIFPLLIYAIFGCSRTLSVGPVAIVSLMVANAIGASEVSTISEAMSIGLLLALLSGLFLLLLGSVRLGFLTNFVSHSVVSGFTSAAALTIGISQLKSLIGYDLPPGGALETLAYLVSQPVEINTATLVIGIVRHHHTGSMAYSDRTLVCRKPGRAGNGLGEGGPVNRRSVGDGFSRRLSVGSERQACRRWYDSSGLATVHITGV